MARLFTPTDLENKVAQLIRAAGSSDAESRLVAANLVLANLSGHDSHGIGMAPRYVDAVLEKNLKPDAQVAIRLDSGVLTRLRREVLRSHQHNAATDAARAALAEAAWREVRTGERTAFLDAVDASREVDESCSIRRAQPGVNRGLSLSPTTH